MTFTAIMAAIQGWKYIRHFVAILVVVLLLLGLYLKGFSDGTNDATEKFEAAARIEAARVAKINKDAIESLISDIEAMRQEVNKRDETIESLLKQASEDPFAGRDSISVDGVRRLNSITGTSPDN